MAVLCYGKRWTDKTPVLKFTCSSRIQMLVLSADDDWTEMNWVHTKEWNSHEKMAPVALSRYPPTSRQFALSSHMAIWCGELRSAVELM